MPFVVLVYVFIQTFQLRTQELENELFHQKQEFETRNLELENEILNLKKEVQATGD